MEGDSTQPFLPFPLRNFNPLPPHGGRPNPQIVFSASVIFQSTPSAWRETIAFYFGTQTEKFQSTPSAWRETEVERDPYFELIISIHSLRMEGDIIGGIVFCKSGIISIHSLRMEGDQSILLRITSSGSFQSTPSAWRETQVCYNIYRG